MTDPLVLAEVDEGILRVTLNRPRKHNALSPELLDGIREAFEAQLPGKSLKIALLRGAGEKFFAAGGDLRALAGIRTIEDAEEMADRAKAALDAVRRFPLPVIGVLNGDALGGGSELAMACDFRVASSQARIGFVQGRLNISTAWGGGIDLMRRIGPSRALGLLCRSQLLDCQAALGLGLIDSYPGDGQSLEEHLSEFTSPFLRQKPQVLRAFKALAQGMREGLTRPELNRLETRMFAETWVHADHWKAADKILK